jgi:hypothetical protein
VTVLSGPSWAQLQALERADPMDVRIGLLVLSRKPLITPLMAATWSILAFIVGWGPLLSFMGVVPVLVAVTVVVVVKVERI